MAKVVVIGDPISHSRSPLLHNFWIRKHGLSGTYDRLRVTAADAPAFFAGFASSDLIGANVTIPLKELAFAGVDQHDETARALGAVNTLWLEENRLVGGNTDAYGFLANLDAARPGWDRAGGPAVVLGAGGAARAIIHALASRNIGPITIANRTMARARDLADSLAGDLVVVEWDAADSALAGARLLVNTTALGMAGGPPLHVDVRRLAPGAIVTDIVYTPLVTPLLARAREAGLANVDGLGMLLHQAVPGFEKWFGVRPQVTPELRALVVADLGAAAGDDPCA